MNMQTIQCGSHSVRKNEGIFIEGQTVRTLSILLKGKADVIISPFDDGGSAPGKDVFKNSFKLFSLDGNYFMGSNDLFTSKKYSFSYLAADDCNLYTFPASTPEQIKAIFDSQKEYAAYIVNSITTLITNSYSALNKLNKLNESMNALIDNLIVYYWALKENFCFPRSASGKYMRKGLDYLEKAREKELLLPAELTESFFETDHSEIYDSGFSGNYEINNDAFDYYVHFAKLPVELRKAYLSADPFITDHHCQEASELLGEIQSRLREGFQTFQTFLSRIYSENKECILTEYMQAAFEMKKNNSNPALILNMANYIISRLKEIIRYMNSEYNHSLQIDTDKISEMADKINTADKTIFEFDSLSMNPEGLTEGAIPEELRDSTERILEYSDIPRDRAQLFLSALEVFRSLKDKLSGEPAARDVRKAASSVFFEIYESVFKRVIEEKNNSRLYHMFLNFAYMDDRLVSAENIISLYKHVNTPNSTGLCPVHNMRDWLMNIYNMKKDPSINEFGQDYFDVFRELKRRRDISEKEKAEYENDRDGRLSYEISSMLKPVQRLCHGQISVYFPILHDEMITRDISKALVTADKINEGVRKILDVDFSAFHREISYRNAEKGIEKELIMKAVVPDFILVPIFGSRAFMWQELTGRSRTSPGRLILPVLTDESIDDLVIKLIGNFRWELCRTMMGVSWNDITQKSLTSEYVDYIQFFKKNRDLSEDAKGKIKSQLLKCHNMARDVFTLDYETWINYESKGILRLNKVVRSILYRHCPFSREIWPGDSGWPNYL